MNLKRLLRQVGIATSLAVATLAAQAANYQFVLTGGYTASWQLQSTVVSDASVEGLGFILLDVAGDFPDSLLNVVDLTFFHSDNGGGMSIEDYYGDQVLLSTDGPQLYSGPEDNPTFLLGSFALTEYQGSTTYTLTISEVSAVPEPASVAMLLAGFGVVGAAVARRRRCETETADTEA